MNRYKKLLSISLLLLLTPLDAVLAKDGGSAKQAHTLMQAFFDASDTPGLAVSVGLGGTIIWSEGFGYADLEQRVKVDPAHTRLRIGSVIKPMTAHAVAQLVRAGKLDLEAPIQTYVPDFPPKGEPITTRQLLGHLSGIRHYRGDEFFNRDHYESVTQGLVIFQDDPLVHMPGDKYLYSSYGYNLVSAIIEGASGQTYLQYMSASVFGPLGMDTTVPDVLAQVIPGRGRYYYKSEDELLNTPEVDNSYKWASGGVIGSAQDLVRFGFAQLDKGPVIDIVHRMFWVAQTTNDGQQTNYGLGWIIRVDKKGRQWIGHGGGSVGGTTQFWIHPDSGLVIAMISNLSDFSYGDIVTSLADVFLPIAN